MIDFPAAPAIGQIHSIGGALPVSWRFDGVKWLAVTAGSEIVTTTIDIDTTTTLPIGYSGEVLVDTSAGPITVMLPLDPSLSQDVMIKDKVGQASTNPITVGGNGKEIEGQPTLVIAFNYGWVRLIYSGVQWLQS